MICKNELIQQDNLSQISSCINFSHFYMDYLHNIIYLIYKFNVQIINLDLYFIVNISLLKFTFI